MRKWTLLVLIPILAFTFASCGGGAALSNAINAGGGTVSGTVPQFQHVAIIVFENASYNEVVGNPVMPYLNSLPAKGSLLQSYYANAHPSIPNYFMLTTGQPVTFDDTYSGVVTVDNLAREFLASGLTWKSYEEDIPSVGYTGGDTGLYIERHEPFSYFSDVRNSSTETANLVPYTQLAADMANNALPNFLWISPNAIDSAHSCPATNPNCTLNQRLAAADAWMSTNVAALLNNPTFASNGLLIIVFDEGDTTDVDHGGGHIPGIFLGTHVKAGYASTATYQHQDIEGLIGRALRLTTVPGAGASGGSMTEFFQ